MSLPPARKSLEAPDPRSLVCLVCGRPLAEERYWITRYPHGEHERCVAWEQRAFPFERELIELRGIARILRGTYRRTVEIGRWLGASRASWPTRSTQVVQAFRERREALKQQLNRVRDQLRLR